MGAEKFRKKPVVIEAEQLLPPEQVPAGVRAVEWRGGGGYNYFVDTLEGRMAACAGDWIITGITGEKYPCKPDIFAATYERVTPRPTDEGEE
jgi:hypothetical protein